MKKLTICLLILVLMLCKVSPVAALGIYGQKLLSPYGKTQISSIAAPQDTTHTRKSILRFKMGTGFPEWVNLGVGLHVNHRNELHVNVSFVVVTGTETIYLFAVPALEHRWLFGPLLTNQRRFYWKNTLGALIPTGGYYGWGSAIGINLGKKPMHSISLDAGMSGVFREKLFIPTIRLQKNFHFHR